MNYKRQIKAIRSITNLSTDTLLNITNLKVGSVFSYKKNIFSVKQIGTYTEKDGFNFFELECYSIKEDKIVYFEWEKDDEIEIYLTTQELKMRDLNKDSDQIEEISEEESGSVTVNGTKYEYEDDYGATWKREKESSKVYFYEFESSSGECLTIEEWESTPDNYEYKAYLSKEVYLDDIEVISL